MPVAYDILQASSRPRPFRSKSSLSDLNWKRWNEQAQPYPRRWGGILLSISTQGKKEKVNLSHSAWRIHGAGGFIKGAMYGWPSSFAASTQLHGHLHAAIRWGGEVAMPWRDSPAGASSRVCRPAVADTGVEPVSAVRTARFPWSTVFLQHRVACGPPAVKFHIFAGHEVGCDIITVTNDVLLKSLSSVGTAWASSRCRPCTCSRRSRESRLQSRSPLAGKTHPPRGLSCVIYPAESCPRDEFSL